MHVVKWNVLEENTLYWYAYVKSKYLFPHLIFPYNVAIEIRLLKNYITINLTFDLKNNLSKNHSLFSCETAYKAS